MEVPSFEELYATHADRIRGLVYTMLRSDAHRDPALVDEISQEIWLKVYLHPPTSAGNLPAWLTRITRFTVIDAIRRAQVQARHRADQTIDDLALCLLDEHEIDETMLSEPVERAWRKLKASDRQLLLLDAQEYPIAEICKIVGSSYTTTRITIIRARQKFRKAYAAS